MGDDEDRVVPVGFAHMLEHFDEVAEAPQIDARLRLVEHRKLALAGEHGGYFNPLELAARQACVDLAIDIVAGAQSHLGQVIAGFGDGYVAAYGYAYKVAHLYALEADGILKGVAYAQLCALGDA